MEGIGDREGKMERYYLTGQSPQRSVAPMEEQRSVAPMEEQRSVAPTEEEVYVMHQQV